jgi:hypothetical protein
MLLLSDVKQDLIELLNFKKEEISCLPVPIFIRPYQVGGYYGRLLEKTLTRVRIPAITSITGEHGSWFPLYAVLK